MHELTKDLNNNERLSFPVTYELKVIMEATISDDVNKANIEMVLKSLDISHKFLRNRLSSVGRYMSFTYSVTITDYQQLQALYEQLRPLPGIKFAL